MRITLKLYASLGAYLPKDADKQRGTRLDIDPQETARGVLARYQVPEDKAHLVLLNGIYLSPAQRNRPAFKDGDTLAVWPPVAGG